MQWRREESNVVDIRSNPYFVYTRLNAFMTLHLLLCLTSVDTELTPSISTAAINWKVGQFDKWGQVASLM